ncbi:kinase-like domain-containing protein [Lyophyllum atratum]|nr:kinase-like domain-containing protein [Lyophyllum atratum]
MYTSPLETFYFNGSVVEDVRSYKPGGYHPVHLGDTFSTCPGTSRPRYKVLHKLGYGAFSTVWLAEDMADDHRGVAMKITVGDAKGGHREAGILETLSLVTDASDPGQKHVLQLLDRFQIHGPNGTHEVLITDILVSCRTLRDLEALDAKRASYHALLGLDYLTRHGVIHGDVHTDNIAFTVPGLNKLSAKEWMDRLEDAVATPVVPRRLEDQSESLPKYLVDSADISDVVTSLIEKHGKEEICAVITDFGNAVCESDAIPDPCTPLPFCPPETLLCKELGREPRTFGWRSRSDIWSLGCSIYEMVKGLPLFTWIPNEKRLLDRIVELAGPLPQSWLDLLDEKPKPHVENDNATLQVTAATRRRTQFGGETGFALLMSSMLRTDPTDRKPTERLIENSWFDDIRGEGYQREAAPA